MLMWIIRESLVLTTSSQGIHNSCLLQEFSRKYILRICGATQNFREFEHTAENISATNLRCYVPLAVSFNR